MTWSFEFLPEHGVVSARTTGDLDYDAVIEFVTAAAAEMQRHRCDNILVDHREAVLKVSPTRMYRLPAVEVAHGVDQRRKVAVVISASTARTEDVLIYTDLMQRNGLPHRVFADPDAALAWLLDRDATGGEVIVRVRPEA